MKKYLLLSWILFAAVLATVSIADDYPQKSAVGLIESFVVKRVSLAGMEYVVSLDDAEIQRIKEACRQ